MEEVRVFATIGPYKVVCVFVFSTVLDSEESQKSVTLTIEVVATQRIAQVIRALPNDWGKSRPRGDVLGNEFVLDWHFTKLALIVEWL